MAQRPSILSLFFIAPRVRRKKRTEKPTALEAEQRGGFSVRPDSPKRMGLRFLGKIGDHSPFRGATQPNPCRLTSDLFRGRGWPSHSSCRVDGAIKQPWCQITFVLSRTAEFGRPAAGKRAVFSRETRFAGSRGIFHSQANHDAGAQRSRSECLLLGQGCPQGDRNSAAPSGDFLRAASTCREFAGPLATPWKGVSSCTRLRCRGTGLAATQAEPPGRRAAGKLFAPATAGY